MAAADAATINYVVPLITASGTVLAAIVTGFLAAALKHRWDVAADRQRYEREAAQRWDVELRQLYAQWLAEVSELIRHDYGKDFELRPIYVPYTQLFEQVYFIAPDEVLEALQRVSDAVTELMALAVVWKTERESATGDDDQRASLYRELIENARKAVYSAKEDFKSAARATLTRPRS